MQKKWIKSLGAILMALTLFMGMVGCATQKLDQNPGQTEETVQESQTTAGTEVTEDTETTTEPTEATEEAQTTEQPAQTPETKPTAKPASKPAAKPTEAEKPSKDEQQTVTAPVSDGSQTGQDEHKTDPVPEGEQLPVEPGEIEVEKKEPETCYLSISCKTILNNMDKLKEGKEVLVPANGFLLGRTAVSFYPGESVYDILKRVTTEKRIHMDSRFTPMYNSAYIEGIGNLYELDCGSGSGWMYCVNGWFPNYGVSRYVPKSGDEIQLIYTCDLGRDIGAKGAAQ